MKNLCLLAALVATHFFILPSLYSQQPIRLTCTPGSNSITVKIETEACLTLVAPINISWYSGSSSGEKIIDFVPDSTLHIEVISNLPSGTYSINVTTGNQCYSFCSATVDCPITIEEATIVRPTCHGVSNGSISLLVENAVGEVTYKWSDGSTEGPVRTGLSDGDYSVTITDQGNGCLIDSSFSLFTDIIGLSPYLIANYPDSSFALPRTGGFLVGIDNGQFPFSMRAINPIANYDYTKSNIQSYSGFSLGQLAAGKYMVILTDSVGCQDSIDVNIGYKRVIPPGELFILEYADNITQAEYNANLSKLKGKAVKKKACRCGNGSIEYLQLWESTETIELLTSGDGSTTKTRPDTSGLSRRLIDPTWVDRPGTVNTPPCQGSAPSPKNVNVAVIDSGMDLLSPQRPNGHAELDDVYWTNGRTASGAPNPECHTDDYEGYDFVGETGALFDSIGHGTHLSGIIKYTTPANVNAKLMNLKVCSPDPNYAYSVFDLTCALHYAVDSGAQVINLSLGYTEDIPSLPLYNALKRAEMANIPVIVSAGNSGQDLAGVGAQARWPVFFKKTHGNGEFQPLTNLLVVTSINDANNDLDNYANSGRGLVDIATVGNYYSTYSYYNTAGVYQQDWQAFKGTSQAAAYASSVIGTIKAHLPTITPAQLFRSLAATHQPVPNLATKLNIGGLLNAEALYKSLSVPVNFPKGIDARTRLSHKWLKTDKLFPGQTVIGTLQHKGVKTVLNNVNFIIKVIKKDGSEHEIHRRFYCSTDTVEWTLPNPVPSDHDYYFAILTTNGVAIGNRMKLTKQE